MEPTPTTQTTTSRVELTEPQKNILNLAMPFAETFAKNPPRLSSAPFTAGYNGLMNAGEAVGRAAVNPMAEVAARARDTHARLTNPALLDAASNPHLQSYIQAAVRPITESFLEDTLPGIRSGAVASGQYGGSRQAIAEGIASGRTSRAIGDTSAAIASQGYGQGLQAQQSALGMTDMISDVQLDPSRALFALGEGRRAERQAQLDEIHKRQLFEQLRPLLMGQELIGLVNATPGATAVATGPGPQKPSPFQQILGGASAIAGLIGPLLSLSDARAKRIGARVGTTDKGVPLYTFQYNDSDETRIGPIAQEVATMIPEAVYDVGGLLAVNYGAI